MTDVRWTYEEYAALPDDGRRYQILDGDLEVTPAPPSAHQRVSRNLEFALVLHTRDRRLGAVYDAPIDVILGRNTIVQPDILYLSRARLGLVSKRGIEGAPDLVIEILSPSSEAVDRTRKLQLYARAGVNEYWIVDPDAETVEVHVSAGAAFTPAVRFARGDTLCSPLLPDLELPINEIFAEDA